MNKSSLQRKVIFKLVNIIAHPYIVVWLSFMKYDYPGMLMKKLYIYRCFLLHMENRLLEFIVGQKRIFPSLMCIYIYACATHKLTHVKYVSPVVAS